MSQLQHFKVEPGGHVKLAEIDPAYRGHHPDHAAAAEEIQHYSQRLRALQELLYAEGRRSLLICLQAMDTGGKDGVINHVLGAMNPQGCRVAHFRRPSTEEAAHDFLWRAHRAAPARGEVVIFNRSHYEDVLIARVHELVPKAVWSARYERINEFERTLAEAGTLTLKFYLHISSDEQLERFKARLDDPTKHWKISAADYAERPFWPQYQRAYEEALSRCSTEPAPWYVIPANHKWFRDLTVARIVVERLEAMDLRYPEPAVDLAQIRRQYHAAAAK
ncbi:MAG: polyphosphate kinase 2 family protein [Steroidobacteraceae bacterium]